MSEAVRLLVTRPEADGERTATKLRAHGYGVTLAPLLRVEPVAADFGVGPWDALVLSSANAARAIAQHPRRAELMHLPVFTVGRRTASAARSLGFGNVTSADGNEKDLVRLLAARDRGSAPLLYLAGEDRAGDLARDLAAVNVAVRAVVIYRALKAAALPSEAQAGLAAGQIDGILHYSRRSAAAYVECAKAAGMLERALAPVHFCLSRQVADPLVTAGAGKVQIAAGPQEALIINLILSNWPR